MGCLVLDVVIVAAATIKDLCLVIALMAHVTVTKDGLGKIVTVSVIVFSYTSGKWSGSPPSL